jgi:PHD/YefM family antitoxin component YafN of YafNO toxin-antitoxin module
LRQRAAEIVEAVGASDEPTVVLQRSRPAAYLVNPEHYDATIRELRAMRRALFLHEVREAEAEYAAGATATFEDMDDLIDILRG